MLAVLLLAFLVIRAIRQTINNKIPDGGINESMYVDINGTKQWVSVGMKRLLFPYILMIYYTLD